MNTEKNLAERNLIEAVKNAEGILSSLLNSGQITGVITRAPLEKLLAALHEYKRSI